MLIVFSIRGDMIGEFCFAELSNYLTELELWGWAKGGSWRARALIMVLGTMGTAVLPADGFFLVVYSSKDRRPLW